MTANRRESLAKLAKIIALHDDPAAMEGQRAACRHVGGKIAAELGIDFSRKAIDEAMRVSRTSDTSGPAYSFDVDEWASDWARQWTAMTPAERKAYMEETDRILKDIERRNEEWRKREAQREAEREAERTAREAELEKLRQYEKACREEEKALRREARRAEKAEAARKKRVRTQTEAPQWPDLDDDHLEWLARIEALEISDRDRAMVENIRLGVRNGCLGLYGASLSAMNALLQEVWAANGGIRPRKSAA